MDHEDFKVKVSGPDDKYSSHLLRISSKGTFCLDTNGKHSNLWIHHMEIDTLRLIRDTIDNHLAKYLPKEAPENETPAEVQKLGWCQSCEEKTLHIQDPRDGWWRCSVQGCEAESQELTPE